MAQRLAEKYRKLIASEYADSDGYWIALVPGYMDGTNPQCHEIHADTQNLAYDILRMARLCSCSEHKAVR
jgi:hypothetical protein